MPTHLALELTGAAAGVTIALLLLFLAAVRHYSDPSERHPLATAVVVLSLTTTLLAVLMVPLDVYAVSHGALELGELRVRLDSIEAVYDAVHVALLALSLGAVPFAFFYVEEDEADFDRERSALQKAAKALRCTLVVGGAFAALLFAGLLVLRPEERPTRAGIKGLDGAWVRQLLDLEHGGLSVLNFAVAALGAAGAAAWLLYTAYGVVMLPASLCGVVGDDDGPGSGGGARGGYSAGGAYSYGGGYGGYGGGYYGNDSLSSYGGRAKDYEMQQRPVSRLSRHEQRALARLRAKGTGDGGDGYSFDDDARLQRAGEGAGRSRAPSARCGGSPASSAARSRWRLLASIAVGVVERARRLSAGALRLRAAGRRERVQPARRGVRLAERHLPAGPPRARRPRTVRVSRLAVRRRQHARTKRATNHARNPRRQPSPRRSVTPPFHSSPQVRRRRRRRALRVRPRVPHPPRRVVAAGAAARGGAHAARRVDALPAAPRAVAAVRLVWGADDCVGRRRRRAVHAAARRRRRRRRRRRPLPRHLHGAPRAARLCRHPVARAPLRGRQLGVRRRCGRLGGARVLPPRRAPPRARRRG